MRRIRVILCVGIRIKHFPCIYDLKPHLRDIGLFLRFLCLAYMYMYQLDLQTTCTNQILSLKTYLKQLCD